MHIIGYFLPYINETQCIDGCCYFYCHHIPLLLPFSYNTKYKSSQINQREDRTRIVNSLIKVKLQALAIELVALLKSSSPYAFFLGISKVTGFTSSTEYQVLKDFTVKLLYQRLEQHRKFRRKKLRILDRINLLNKK